MTGTENEILNNEDKPAEESCTNSASSSDNHTPNKKFKEYPSVLERYYTPMYCLNMDEQPIDHHCVLFHTNKICLLTIAPSHPVIAEKKSVSKINCILDNKVDRSKNKVSGKGKKGGQKLLANTILCSIECSDGSTYKVYSCVKGKLIEMNENLFENPNLLVDRPCTEGHIAIILCDLSTVEECKKVMLEEKEYKKNIQESN